MKSEHPFSKIKATSHSLPLSTRPTRVLFTFARVGPRRQDALWLMCDQDGTQECSNVAGRTTDQRAFRPAGAFRTATKDKMERWRSSSGMSSSACNRLELPCVRQGGEQQEVND